MTSQSNIRPIGPRDLLARAHTHLSMVSPDTPDGKHIQSARALITLLLDVQPVAFPSAPTIFCAQGLIWRLSGIVHRGGLLPGDIEAIRAAVVHLQAQP